MQSDVTVLKERLDDLIAIAKQITNTDFLLQIRNLDMPDRKVMKKLLEFLAEKIKFDVSKIGKCTEIEQNNISSIHFQKHTKVGEEIREQLLRLNTLQLIDPNECMMHWQKFVQHPNLGNYCVKYLETVTFGSIGRLMNIKLNSMHCAIITEHISGVPDF